MKTTIIILTLLTINTFGVFSQKGQIRPFPLQDVKLMDGMFKHAQDLDLKYILELDADRLLAPFFLDAGLEPKAPKYGNWESTGLDGHTLGHYVTALALMYASTGNTEINKKLNYTIDELARCQDKNGNGYVGGIPNSKGLWEDLKNAKLDVTNFSLNKRWVPWYNIHKTYAGLRDAYIFAGNTKAKEILIKLSDWCFDLTNNLTDEQMQKMLQSEHGGMNEIFADVAEITGDKKYLQLAKRFSHKSIYEPLSKKQDKLNGLHANTQIPKIIGFKRIGEETGDSVWTNAARFFWETVVYNRSVTIGGNSVREHFHPANDFSSMVDSKEGPESCNTYNMLKLTKLLFQTESSVRYIDYYERSLYNHILSTQHPEHGGFVYFTPMRPQHYRVYSQPQSCFWCCVGSGIENHGKYGELIYAESDNTLYVNLFIPSQLNWKEKGITLTQETAFPDSETTTLKLKLNKSSKFKVNIRYPSWVKNGALAITINGKPLSIKAQPSTFVTIDRKWANGDKIEVKLPMHTTFEFLPDKKPWVSILHGPIVLAAKTDTSKMPGLIADDSRMGHIAHGPLIAAENAPMIVSAEPNFTEKIKPIPGKTLTFSANEILYPDKYKNLELIPFYRLHDSRYMIYWQYTTPAELEKMKAKIRQEEQARLALEAITIDQVAPGEQQPETEHNFKSERTESGVHMDRHWRHANGWFSYDLKNNNKEAALLQVTYSGTDRGRNFNILINDKLLATQTLDGSKGDKFFTVDYEIPQDFITTAPNNILTVKFEAHQGSIAGGVYYVRLIKKL